MILIIGFFRTYLPQEKVKKWISGRKYGAGNIVASLFGAVTPFCSCSALFDVFLFVIHVIDLFHVFFSLLTFFIF